jgi:hypothetical protein
VQQNSNSGVSIRQRPVYQTLAIEHTAITDRGTGVVKAQKPKARVTAKNEHTWRVSRTNSQSVDIRADALSIMDGDLVFTKKGVPVRIIAADTYTDVELMAPAGD